MITEEKLNDRRFVGEPCKKCGNSIYYKRSKYCVRCARITYAKCYKNNTRGYRERVLDYARLRRYNLTREAHQEMVAKQNNRCYCCGKENNIKSKALFVDHNHETGKVRKLLCYRCNTAIGTLENPLFPVWLKYLEEHK